jgi:hyperosmotically inducible periplasmic protein
MKNLLLLAMLSLTLVACDRQDRPNNSAVNREEYNNDNTGKNVRDRDYKTITPLDQSENERDLTITQKIRQALIADNALSINAKNIKIITINGVVTLRGPVDSDQERAAIVNKVNNVQGIAKLDNQLEVVRSH